MIDLGQPWGPAVSQRLAVPLNLGALGRAIQAQAHVDLEEDSKTQVTAASTRLVITCLTIGDQFGIYLKTMMRSSGKSTVGDDKGEENTQFHNVMFGKIKTQTVGGRTVKIRDVHKKIKKG